jgi:hypothetical protein
MTPPTSTYNQVVVITIPGDNYIITHDKHKFPMPMMHAYQPLVFAINHMLNEDYMCKLYMN